MTENLEEELPQKKFSKRRKVFLGIGSFILISILLIVVFTIYFVTKNPP